LKDMQLLIQGPDFLHEEKRDTLSEIDYLHKDDQGRPLSLAYRLINRDKQDRYTIEKQVFTDPDQQSLIMKVILTAKVDGLQAYRQADPHVAKTGIHDRAWANGQTTFAQEGETVLALTTTVPGAKAGTGFMGASDAATQLRQQGQVTHYNTSGATPGN